jgi:hypothetical protein
LVQRAVVTVQLPVLVDELKLHRLVQKRDPSQLANRYFPLCEAASDPVKQICDWRIALWISHSR